MTFALNPVLSNLFAGAYSASQGAHRSTNRRLVPALCGPTSIDKGAILVMNAEAGNSVCCVSGSLWITLDGQLKDVLLEAGETWLADRSARMLIFGLAPSTALVG